MTLILLILLQSPDMAIANKLGWENARSAKILSNITVATSIGLNCINDRTKECYKNQLISSSITIGINEILKRTIKRLRPDASDNKSFPSMHTALACNVSNKYLITTCASTGYLRIAAYKHWFSDTLMGASIGAITAYSINRSNP